MERVVVHGSSNIASRGYEEDTKTLEVGFINRKGGAESVYQYFGVPQEVWIDWLQAPSSGQFFAAKIKGAYPSQKVG